MSASPKSQTVLTAEEFWELPEPPHGGRTELVEGRVVEEMPVGRLHARIAGRLVKSLSLFVDEHRLGEVHVELGHRTATDPDTVRAPDVSFMAADRLGPTVGDRYVEGAPTLAIEVMSPEDREADVAHKVEEYFDAGAERVWIVRPRNRTVTVHRPGGDAHTYSGASVLASDDAGFSESGFELDLAQIFAD
jgi:Uma2 family endonuclease